MKVEILDPAVFRALRPLEVASYLRFKGWELLHEQSDLSSEWVHETETDHFRLKLPMRHSVLDFSRRMHEVLEELAEAESRSQLEVLRDLVTTSSDLLRMRSAGPDLEQGSIGIEAGLAYMESAREAVLAAACAAVRKSAQFPTRKPTEASEYLKKVRLGQTEVGSFIFTILCPIPPELTPTASIVPIEPFGRRVTRTLMTALTAAYTAARQAVETGNFAPFRESVQSGVSANLCDALVKVGEAVPDASINVSVAWARNRAGVDLPPSTVYFDAEMIPVLKEASRVFRATEPERGIEIVGFVVQLRRLENETLGHVVVAAINDGQVRKVLIDMHEELYAVALQANERRSIVSCTGDLLKLGRSYQLQNPRNFSVLADQQEQSFDIFAFGEESA